MKANNPRLESLQARMRLAGGLLENEVQLGNGTRIEFWKLQKRIVLVQDFGADGIEVYVPATTLNDINAVYEVLKI